MRYLAPTRAARSFPVDLADPARVQPSVGRHQLPKDDGTTLPGSFPASMLSGLNGATLSPTG